MKANRVEAAEATLAEKVSALRLPSHYPEPTTRVEAVETHMSWVFLTDQFAYKLKKPVKLDYLDFSSLTARRRNCLIEARLNRRLARDIYLGVRALTRDRHENIVVDGNGDIIDWLVKMRRLPAHRMLDTLISQGPIDAEDARRLGAHLAQFYASCVPQEVDENVYLRQQGDNVRLNLRLLLTPSFGLPANLLYEIHERQLRFVAQHEDQLRRRVREGRIVEGHGDLRPEHVCLEHRPVVFDCLEFNRAFRIVDVADELASLVMECERLGNPLLTEALFGAYEGLTGDHPTDALVAYYKCYRACLRARLAAWHMKDHPADTWPKWRQRAVSYLKEAARHSLALG